MNFSPVLITRYVPHTYNKYFIHNERETLVMSSYHTRTFIKTSERSTSSAHIIERKAFQFFYFSWNVKQNFSLFQTTSERVLLLNQSAFLVMFYKLCMHSHVSQPSHQKFSETTKLFMNQLLILLMASRCCSNFKVLLILKTWM